MRIVRTASYLQIIAQKAWDDNTRPNLFTSPDGPTSDLFFRKNEEDSEKGIEKLWSEDTDENGNADPKDKVRDPEDKKMPQHML